MAGVLELEGISVDLIFETQGPKFGDLFTICGYENPNFPPEGHFNFLQFEALQFSQIDDYFGVQTTSGIGDEVAVWLFPLVDGEVVDHHPGPFDGLRLSYNVLRNPVERSKHSIYVVEELSQSLKVKLNFNSAGNDLKSLERDIQAIVDFWAGEGIKVGSNAALEIDY